MKLLASPRMRRRVMWLGVMSLAAAAVGSLILLFPERHEAATPLTPGGTAAPKPERSVKRGKGALVEPLEVAEKFLNTAVARRNVDASWELIDPSFPGKEEFTRSQWAKGDIPVVPFPVVDARYRVDYSYRNAVGLRVALFPPKGNTSRPAIFDIELHASGRGDDRKWLVSSYMPSGRTDSGSGFGTARGIAGLPDLNPKARPGESRLGSIWLLVPLSIVFLALTIPIGVAVMNSVRGRRAEREFARGA